MQAEKKCIKRKRQTEWSAELHQTSKMCKYWVKLYKGMRNAVHAESSVAKPKAELQEKMRIEIEVKQQSTWRNVNEKIKRLKKETIWVINYKQEYIKNHEILLEKGLLALKELRENEQDEAKEKTISIIIQQDQTTKYWNRIKKICNL